MPIKVDIQTNFNDFDLTVESCSEIIASLQHTYTNIRQEMYSHFLSFKHLSRAILFAGILFLLYLFSEDFLFILLMPISVVISLIFSLVSAEYLTTQTRKIIHQQLEHYTKKREMLLKDQKIKA